MGRHNIRVFVNKRNLIETSPFTSLYSFRQAVREKLWSDVDHDLTLNMYLSGKRLGNESDTISLTKLGFEDNSNVTVTPSVKGGFNTIAWLLWIIYYLCLAGYVIFLFSGFITLFANIFAVTFNNTIFSVITYFMSDPNSTFAKFMKLFIRFCTWMLRHFATLFFVWILTAYMIFPWFYGKANKYCESALAAKRVGWWAMFIFTIIYVYMNIGDFVFNIAQEIAGESPQIIDASVSPPLQGFKEVWDQLKELIFDLIPGVASYHMIVEEVIFALYDVSGIVGQMDCQDTEMLSTLCQFFKTLDKVAKGPKGMTLNKFSKEANKVKKEAMKRERQQKGGYDYLNDNLSDFEFSDQEGGVRIKNKAPKKLRDKGKTKKQGLSNLERLRKKLESNHEEAVRTAKSAQKTAENVEKTPEASGLLAMSLSDARPTIKNYRLGPGIELLSVGFCDRLRKDEAKDKGVPYEEVPKVSDNPKMNEKYKPGSFNRWSAGLFTSFFCQIVEAVDDLSNTLNNVGTDNQVVNMIETGNVAGLGAAIYLLIIIIYTFFSSSYAGFKFG